MILVEYIAGEKFGSLVGNEGRWPVDVKSCSVEGKVVLNGEPAKLEDLQPGDTVEPSGNPATSIMAWGLRDKKAKAAAKKAEPVKEEPKEEPHKTAHGHTAHAAHGHAASPHGHGHKK
jgi:hypothetical protein